MWKLALAMGVASTPSVTLAESRWWWVSTQPTHVSFVDVETVSSKGDTVEFWMRTIERAPSSEGIVETKSLHFGDCGKRNTGISTMTTYRADRTAVETTSLRPWERTADPAIPESTAERMLQLVCGERFGFKKTVSWPSRVDPVIAAKRIFQLRKLGASRVKASFIGCQDPMGSGNLAGMIDEVMPPARREEARAVMGLPPLAK